jgi:small neutral amino acid transporter SnatA (MarC family)
MERAKLLKTALLLSIITIAYNIAEGVVSVVYGLADETLALMGFGVDSFVEVLSGAGILHMVIRMKRSGLSNIDSRDKFERRALRVTGISFFILAGGLAASSAVNIITNTKPETTVAGIIIAILSVLTMYILMKWKLKTGKRLRSNAIIADANCTKTCFYLSFILLGSSVLYELFGIAWFDIAGSIGIAWFAFSEGRESFEKASSVPVDSQVN